MHGSIPAKYAARARATHGFRARAIGFLLSLSLSLARARVHADAAGARMQQVLLPLLFLLKGRVLAAPHAGLQPATGYTDEQLSGVLKNETAYIQWQGSKTLDNPSWIQSVDRRVEQFVRQQYAKEDVRGRTVLCIGARGGGEVAHLVGGGTRWGQARWAHAGAGAHPPTRAGARELCGGPARPEPEPEPEPEP